MNEIPFSSITQSLEQYIVEFHNISFQLKNITLNTETHDFTNEVIPRKRKTDEPKIKEIRINAGELINIYYGSIRKGLHIPPKKKKKNKNRQNNFESPASSYISIGNKNPHCMIFKKSIKIAGCKVIEDAINTIKFLWEKISNDNSNFSLIFIQIPKVIFTREMVNYNIKLGVNFNITKLLKVFIISKDATTLDYNHKGLRNENENNIKLEFFKDIPDIVEKDTIIFNKNEIIHDIDKIEKNDIIRLSKKKKIINKTSVTIFHTSSIIFSGKYTLYIEEIYNFIMKIIRDNYNDIIIDNEIYNNPPPFIPSRFIPIEGC